jgi:hypothetical protein
MGPLDILYCWQSLLCAVAVIGVMKAVTAAIDLAIGKDRRRANRWLSYFVLPMATVLLGFVYGAVVPLRPDALSSYLAEHEIEGWRAMLSAGMWGAACGQFAQTLYDRAKDLVRSRTGRSLPGASEPPPAPAKAGGTAERP